MSKLRRSGKASLMEEFRQSQNFDDDGKQTDNNYCLARHHFWELNFRNVGKKYLIHRLYLVQASSYFRKNIYYSEFEKMKVEYGETVEGEIFSGIIETFESFFIPYLYNEAVVITSENFMFVYMIAERWQFDEVLRNCEKFVIDAKHIIDYVNTKLQCRGINSAFQVPERLHELLFTYCLEHFDVIEADSFRRLNDPYYMCGIVEKTKHDVHITLSTWINVNYELLYEAEDMFLKIQEIVKIDTLNVLSIYNVKKFFKMDVADCLEVIVDKFMVIRNKEFKKIQYHDLQRIIEDKKKSKDFGVHEKMFQIVKEFHEVEEINFVNECQSLEGLEDVTGIVELGRKLGIGLEEFGSPFFTENSGKLELVTLVKNCARKRIKRKYRRCLARLWFCVNFKFVGRGLINSIIGFPLVSRKVLENATTNQKEPLLLTWREIRGVECPTLFRVEENSGRRIFCGSRETFSDSEVSIIRVVVSFSCCGRIGIVHGNPLAVREEAGTSFYEIFSTKYEKFDDYQVYGYNIFVGSKVSIDNGMQYGYYGYGTYKNDTNCLATSGKVSGDLVVSDGRITVPNENPNKHKFKTGDDITLVTGMGHVSFFTRGQYSGTIEMKRCNKNRLFLVGDMHGIGQFYIDHKIDKGERERMISILRERKVL